VILFLASLLALVATGSALGPAVQAQTEGRAGAPSGTAVDVNGNKFNPRDLSGIYGRSGGDPGFGPAQSIPPLTPAGEAKLKGVVLPVPSRHPLAKATSDPAQSNDPSLTCNPKGFPRLLLDTTVGNYELIMLPNRMLQLWQEERRPREIWLDGRAVPSTAMLDALGPSWYGHAVGAWQGDTLVVNTVGLEERAWVDSFGFPKSFGARVEERYKLVDPNTLEVTLTLHDAEMYTKPWVSDVKTWKKLPRQNLTRRGWSGLFGGLKQAMCDPTAVKP
jgi:hypothetical protein